MFDAGPIHTKVRDFIEHNRLFDLKGLVLAGVSGGPDSIALLHVLRKLGYPVTAAYYDHGLRPGGDQEADFVRRIAHSLGAGFVTEKGDVPALVQKEGYSVEEAARMLRYGFLFRQARLENAQAVVTAHTADDQVETMLMHLLRGAGLAGLKGMLPRTILPAYDPDIPLVRPALQVWRTEILAYCRDHGLAGLEDPSNQDTRLFRNRIRHELIPSLENYNPSIRERLLKTTQTLAWDESALKELTEEKWGLVLAEEAPEYISLRTEPFLHLSPGLQARILRLAIVRLAPEVRDVDFDTTMRALAPVGSPSPGAGQDLVANLRIFREQDRIWISQSSACLPKDRWPQLKDDGHFELRPPALFDLANGWRLEAQWLENPPPGFESNTDPYLAWLALEPGQEALALRPRRKGDRIRPLGMKKGSLKLSDFMINAGLPERFRRRWPLVCIEDEIAWVPGGRIGERFRVGGAGMKILQLHCLQQKGSESE